ncbi:MAG: hypothetical protein JNM25_12890, partial [Planctomycetes bacterium]|nr:hypothetical protein [Planctomycetota bacterium]
MTPLRLTTHAIGLAVLVLATNTVAAQSILAQYGEIVQAVGDVVPAAAPGVTPAPGATIVTDMFGENLGNSPVLDQDGTILYRALIGGGSTTNADNRAYFLGRAAGDLQMVVRAGDQAPGCPAGTLLRNSAGSNGLGSLPRLSPQNEILFYSSNLWNPTNPGSTPASADSALFWGPVFGQLLLAREGDPVPFLGGGELFGSLSLSATNSSINGTGRVLFGMAVTGGAASAGNDGLLVSGLPGALAVVVREGEVLGTGEVVIPVSGGTNLSSINFLNEAGQVLHELQFSTTSGTATVANDRALAIWTPGSGRTIVAREGQPAPGLPAGVLFATPTNAWTPTPVGNCTFTNSGDTVLSAPLAGGGTIAGVDDNALYFGGIGGWTLVMRKGDPCPGLGGGETFGSVGNNSLGCIDGGDLVFLATLVGPSVTAGNDTSTWLRKGGNLGLLAREGDPVPGMAPSGNGPWKFGNMTAGPQTPNLNQRGFVLFENTVSDGIATRNMWFGYTPALGIVRMLGDTDTFTTSLGTGTWNTISTASGSNHSGDVSPKWFDNNGDFVAKLFLNGAAQAAIVRGHLGSLVAEPSAVPVAGNVPHSFHIDLGVAQANRLYLVLATSMGTKPGFQSPFGPQVVPLNIDPLWTDLSLQGSNSIVWPNSLGFLDANGKGIGPSA